MVEKRYGCRLRGSNDSLREFSVEHVSRPPLLDRPDSFHQQPDLGRHPTLADVLQNNFFGLFRRLFYVCTDLPSASALPVWWFSINQYLWQLVRV